MIVYADYQEKRETTWSVCDTEVKTQSKAENVLNGAIVRPCGVLDTALSNVRKMVVEFTVCGAESQAEVDIDHISQHTEIQGFLSDEWELCKH